MSIGQFLDLCLTHTHKHALKQTYTDVDVGIVTHLGPVMSSLVWFLMSHLSFNTPLHNYSYVYHTLFIVDMDWIRAIAHLFR